MDKGKSTFSRPDHVGIIVKNLEKAIAYYQSLGLGPFTIRAMSNVVDKKMYGKPTDFQLKVALASAGPINIELIQPLGNAHLQDEFLRTRGEGINHIGFIVDDLKKETDALTGQGFEIVLSAKRTTVGGANYFDTRKVGGVILELIQR